MANNASEPEWPRREPEIIPPGRAQSSDWDRPAWQSRQSTWPQGTHRIYVTRLGPFGSAVLALIFAALVVVLALAIIGAALLWLPFVALILVAAAVYRFLFR